MATDKKKILIIDETGFSRICSAILEKEGYGTNTISDIQCRESLTVNYDEFGMVITSYPYGAVLFDEFVKVKIPSLILSDRLNRDLVVTLENFDKSLLHCMIKPLDYTKFRILVKHVMCGDASHMNQGSLGRERTGNVMLGDRPVEQ
jgi:hypothetical protein